MSEFQDNRHAAEADVTPEPDALILVDDADHRVGQLSKILCHEGRGVLHRAFSLLIFNGSGELLIQQRAPSKRLWPHYWSNSCCSHPRSGESMDLAIHRRLREELGVSCALQFMFKFQYQAQFDATGAENELCSVFIGRCEGPVRINGEEISAWRWVSPEQLDTELTMDGARKFTPWFIMEWERLRRDHPDSLQALLSQN